MTKKIKDVDYPFEAVIAECEILIEQGHTIHQKFTCGKCGARQTMVEPNRFFMTGKCEVCDYVSNIKTRGCGYTIFISADEAVR